MCGCKRDPLALRKSRHCCCTSCSFSGSNVGGGGKLSAWVSLLCISALLISCVLPTIGHTCHSRLLAFGQNLNPKACPQIDGCNHVERAFVSSWQRFEGIAGVLVQIQKQVQIQKKCKYKKGANAKKVQIQKRCKYSHQRVSILASYCSETHILPELSCICTSAHFSIMFHLSDLAGQVYSQ